MTGTGRRREAEEEVEEGEEAVEMNVDQKSIKIIHYHQMEYL